MSKLNIEDHISPDWKNTVVNTVNKYIDSYTSHPLNFDNFSPLLEPYFRGLLIRNGNEYYYLNKNEYLDYFYTNHFINNLELTIKHRACPEYLKYNVVKVDITSIQRNKMLENGHLKYKVKDTIVLHINDNGLLNFAMHNWIVEKNWN